MDQPQMIGAAEQDPCGAGTAVPHLLHIFPSFVYGGVPIRIANVINHFGGHYRHSIFALDGNLESGSRLDPALGVNLIDPGRSAGNVAARLLAIRRRLAAVRPDLLLTYNWGSVEWALVNTAARAARHVHFESGFGPEETERQMPRRVWARRIALRGAHCLVVPSFTLVAIARDCWRLSPAKIRHIPNGVDCGLFAAAGDPAAAPGFVPRPGELVIGTVAPIRREKNLGRLLRAFARLKHRGPVRLLIAGDGADRPALEALAASLGIAARVAFVGHVEEPHKVYPLMDIFAMSSDTEQMPNTLLQAMAASRPVASVDVGDVRALLPRENAELVAPRGDEAGLAAALDRLLDDGALRARLGEANRRHVVAVYSKERMYAAYRALIDDALAAGRGRAQSHGSGR
jgi:glycosyltransferase involved in cell wall biosynthesis